MIKVNYNIKNGLLKKVIIKGHANYDVCNKDIVCSSVSSIAICSINASLRINENSLKYKKQDGFIEIDSICEDKITQNILMNMIEHFKELSNEYPKNIKIKE